MKPACGLWLRPICRQIRRDGFPELWCKKKDTVFSFCFLVPFFFYHRYLSLSAMQACWKMFTFEFLEAQDLFKIYEGHSFPTVKLPSLQRPSEAAALMWAVCTTQQNWGGVSSSGTGKSPKHLYILFSTMLPVGLCRTTCLRFLITPDLNLSAVFIQTSHFQR